MTNEQLALYLNSIAAQIDSLANSVENSIKEGERTKELHWIGEGEAPLFRKLAYELNPDPKKWDFVDADNFIAVEKIHDFASEIREQAQILLKIE